MYSDKCFDAYFYKQMFFEIFVAKGDRLVFLKKNNTWDS